MSLTEVKQQVTHFSAEERAELQEFLSSLEDSDTLSPTWKDEIERRREEVRSGKVQTLSHEEFWKRVRERRA
jgi:putative addiction module component (TIGR02574 family)